MSAWTSSKFFRKGLAIRNIALALCFASMLPQAGSDANPAAVSSSTHDLVVDEAAPSSRARTAERIALGAGTSRDGWRRRRPHAIIETPAVVSIKARDFRGTIPAGFAPFQLPACGGSDDASSDGAGWRRGDSGFACAAIRGGAGARRVGHTRPQCAQQPMV